MNGTNIVIWIHSIAAYMAITLQKLNSDNIGATKRFVLTHELDIVSVAEEMRKVEEGGKKCADHIVVAFSDTETIAILCITAARILFPYWNTRYSAAIFRALYAHSTIKAWLATAYAVTGRTEVVVDVSTFMIRDSAQFSRRQCVSYLLMTLAKNDLATAHRANDTDSTVHIMPARIEDLLHIFPLQVAYLQEEVRLEHSQALDHRYALRNLRESLDHHTYYIAWSNAKVIAKASSNAEGYTCAQLGGVFTRKEYRNKGVAYRCTTELCRTLLSRYASLVLFVKPQNATAVSLYKRMGFLSRGTYAIHYLS